MQFAERRPPLPQIALVLDADAVMECTVRYAGSSDIVVSARLVDPRSDSLYWSEDYPGNLSDLQSLAAMQADLAVRTATALEADYSPAEQRRIERPVTASHEAYAHYLKARQVLAVRGFDGGYSTDAFRTHIDRSLEADPNFAAAYTDRGFAHLSRAADEQNADQAMGGARNRAAAGELERAHRSAHAALAIDPTQGRAHALLGAIEAMSGNTEAAGAHFEQAIELTQNDAETLSLIAGSYLRDGKRRAALDLLARIRRLDPIDHDVGYYFYLAGDRQTAKEILHRVLESNPAHTPAHAHLGYLAAIERNAAAAEPELRVAEELLRSEAQDLSLAPPGAISTLAYSYGRIGFQDDVRRLVRAFMQAAERGPVPPIRWAEIYLALGDVDRAYESASKIAEVPSLPFVSTEFEFVLNAYNDPIFEEARFRELRRRLATRRLP
jgi:Flp pilus assembly protein TadD